MTDTNNKSRICEVSRIDRETGETIATFYGTTNDEAMALLEAWARTTPQFSAPIPMRLTCPACGALHIDEGEFAVKPHHTHACQECGNVWRPAIVATVGVQFLPGFKNEDKAVSHLIKEAPVRRFNVERDELDEDALNSAAVQLEGALNGKFGTTAQCLATAIYHYASLTGRLP